MTQEPFFYNKKVHFYNEAPKHLSRDSVDQFDDIINEQKKYSQLSRDEFQSDFEKLCQIISQNEQNISTTQDNISLIMVTEQEKQVTIKKIKGSVLYRLYWCYLAWGYPNMSEMLNKDYVLLFEIFINGLCLMSKIDLLIPLVLHASRGLIYDLLAGLEAATILKNSMKIHLVKPDGLQYSTEIKNYKKGVKFFQKVLVTHIVQSAIKEFLESVGILNSNEMCIQAIDILMQMQFTLIRRAHMVSMTGFNNQAYFNLTTLIGLQENYQISRSVANCFHLAGYQLIRSIRQDLGIITPRNKTQSNSLEAGYRLEHILFGSCIYQYWGCLSEQILDFDLWSQKLDLPLLDQTAIEQQHPLKINDCYTSGCEQLIYERFE